MPAGVVCLHPPSQAGGDPLRTRSRQGHPACMPLSARLAMVPWLPLLTGGLGGCPPGLCRLALITLVHPASRGRPPEPPSGTPPPRRQPPRQGGQHWQVASGQGGPQCTARRRHLSTCWGGRPGRTAGRRLGCHRPGGPLLSCHLLRHGGLLLPLLLLLLLTQVGGPQRARQRPAARRPYPHRRRWRWTSPEARLQLPPQPPPGSLTARPSGREAHLPCQPGLPRQRAGCRAHVWWRARHPGPEASEGRDSAAPRYSALRQLWGRLCQVYHWGPLGPGGVPPPSVRQERCTFLRMATFGEALRAPQ